MELKDHLFLKTALLSEIIVMELYREIQPEEFQDDGDAERPVENKGI